MSLSAAQLKAIQGDIWSKGFPKDFETYYFFSIVESEAHLFPQCLKQLIEDQAPLIPNLLEVLGDRTDIYKHAQKQVAEGAPKETIKTQKLPITNALIAFTFAGLKLMEKQLDGTVRSVTKINSLLTTDPAFAAGMASEQSIKLMADPALSTWDPMFRPGALPIHGLLKVAGIDRDQVEKRLDVIKTILKHKSVIVDVHSVSRLDGATRLGANRGKEHFGFEDGISQPLMQGIDDVYLETADPAQNLAQLPMTDPKLLIVTKETHTESSGGTPRKPWMNDGSFLVVRKLEQDVGAFQSLLKSAVKAGCLNEEHAGAKLMGRWKSGAPIAMPKYHTKDSSNPEEAKKLNDFTYGTGEICPFSAHIRKTNPREQFDPNFQDQRARRTTLIRSGIAYGPDYTGEGDKEKRGLLFACYQGSIEDGFQNMQSNWSSNPAFLFGKEPGHDPIIGQVKQIKEGENGELTTFITDKDGGKKELRYQQLVTMKGGEYFFVPSIAAIRDVWTKGTEPKTATE